MRPVHPRTLIGGLMLAGWAIGAPAAAQADQPSATAAPAVLLAVAGATTIDPAPYLVSEKFDGVRAIWDGRTLRFRSGRPIAAPAWFVQRLPRQPLDGELWLGRGQFDALSGLVRGEAPDDARWRQVRYLVFELPGAQGSFAERAAAIERLVAEVAWPQLQAVKQARIESRPALERLLGQTVASGGEGLMLHLASAPYATGRSEALVKLKPHRDDEAVVIAHRDGRGRYAGLLGAIRLQTADGRRFWVGSGFSDAQRRDPPAIGRTVTYRYRDVTPGGTPRFATFLRVRDEP